MSGTRSSLQGGAAAVFATRVAGLGLSVGTTFLLARLLGPTDLGGYYLAALVPATALAALSIGLPSALTYFSGRGESLDAVRSAAIGLALAISLVLVAFILAAREALTATVLAAMPAEALTIIALAVPGTLLTGFCNAVVLGQQRLRLYAVLLILPLAATFIGQTLVVGIAGGGLTDAVTTLVVVHLMSAAISTAAMLRLAPFHWRLSPAFATRLLRYGLKVLPASVAGFFSYRADVFLLSALVRDPAAVGVYALAVNIAELCFYVPDAIATALFPRAAASARAEIAALVPRVARITLLVTGGVAVGIAGAAAVAFPIVLPAFVASLVPAFVLLPGVVALSASKVLSGYMAGIGRPGLVSGVAVAALVLNLVANLVLIPVAGVVGAAAASLISYSANGLAMLRLSAREAGVSAREMVAPTRTDLAILVGAVRSPLRRRAP